MSDLRELYQETIIDHGRHPRNFGMLQEAACHHQVGFNPLCGDKIILHVYEKNNILANMMFEGSGCAISMASASIMIETLKGKSQQEFEEIFAAFHELVTQGTLAEDLHAKLGKLAVFSGVAEFPARVKCASLAWHTLKAALAHEANTVSTEEG